MTYYGPDLFEDYAMAFWYPSEWLHSEWSASKQQHFNDMYNFRIFGWSPFRDQFDQILDKENDLNYMDRYQVDWSDVKDPRKLSQSRNNRFAAMNFVSDNVKRLYKN